MEDRLVGKKIVKVREFTKREIEMAGWESDEVSALCLELDDGSVIYALGDEEGNYPGELNWMKDGKNYYMLEERRLR